MNKFLEEIQQTGSMNRLSAITVRKEGKKLETVCALWKSGEYYRIVFTGHGKFLLYLTAATMISLLVIFAD